jgi:hypothetical protein
MVESAATIVMIFFMSVLQMAPRLEPLETCAGVAVLNRSGSLCS